MNRVIKCRVENEFIRGAGQVIGAATSHDDVELELEFSPVWYGTARTVMWFDAMGENPVLTVLGTNLLVPGETEIYRVPVPAECKAIAGDMMVTIRGVNVSGKVETRAVTAATATFRVLPALWDEEAIESGDIPASEADQIRAELEAIKDEIADAMDAADRAEAAADRMAYVGENGNWFQWAGETGEFVDSGVPATGPEGPEGPIGPEGPEGPVGNGYLVSGYYDTYEELEEAVTAPTPGETFGVGTEAPYDMYRWDGVNNVWVNNGANQGPKGEQGFSPTVQVIEIAGGHRVTITDEAGAHTFDVMDGEDGSGGGGGGDTCYAVDLTSISVDSAGAHDQSHDVTALVDVNALIAAVNGGQAVKATWSDSQYAGDTVSAVLSDLYTNGESADPAIYVGGIVYNKYNERGAKAMLLVRNTDGGIMVAFRYDPDPHEVSTDTTLSEAGKPADAKAVGDMIGNINSALDEINGEVV